MKTKSLYFSCFLNTNEIYKQNRETFANILLVEIMRKHNSFQNIFKVYLTAVS
jgi:hypothetical protein